MLDDPNTNTGLSSKDIVISHNPPISARLYLPRITNQPHHKIPILVYFHGGAFIIESAFSQLYHNYFKAFVPQANTIVVSVEYRLAPEHPLPTCYHDCWNALQWVSSHYSTKNNPPNNADPWLVHHGDFNRVFIGGDSAGANIAHNIALRAGSQPLPCDVKILGAILSHPSFFSSHSIGSEPVEEDQHGELLNLVYPSAPGGYDNPVFNPLASVAPSLAGLGCSKMIVCVAGKDGFKDKGILYYESVIKSGWQGKIQLHHDIDEGHVYYLFNPGSENAKKFHKRLVSFIQE
uniref:Gibberellin receptor GID1L2 n=2 Tax=Cajanus cajan TaxID=3821 RepID=A0A151R916_CAJCA|nr:putative gibberellin receptor GID1L2 [Cajanus cajan]